MLESRLGDFGSMVVLAPMALAAASLASCELIAGVRDGELATGGAPVGGAAGQPLGGNGGAGLVAGGHGGQSSATGGTSSAGGADEGGSGGAPRPSYADEVLADEPLAYWRLGEEVTPTAFDASGNGHDGIYQSVTLGAEGALVGDPDTAANFTLQDSSVTVGDVFGFEGTVPFSVEAWVRPTSVEGGPAFIGKVEWDASSSTYLGWFLWHSDSSLGIRRAGNNVEAPPLTLGSYNYVVATYDGYTMFLYVDGSLAVQESAPESLPVHAQPFTLGRIPNWQALVGSMDEVAVYDHVLSPSRIATHYETGLGLR